MHHAADLGEQHIVDRDLSGLLHPDSATEGISVGCDDPGCIPAVRLRPAVSSDTECC